MTAVRRLITIIVLSLAATTLLAQETPAATPSARATDPVTAETDQDLENPRALRLSLDEAIRTSMEKNLGVQLQAIEYQEAGYSLRSSYGIYDALATALLQESSEERAVSSTIEASAGRTHTLNLGVQQNLPTGGGYSVGVDNSRSTTSGGVSTVSPRYSPNVNFALNQPLLRDFGIDINRRGITFARNTLGINHETFRTRLMDTAVSVEQAYLDLAYARRAVDVVKDSLFLARDQARITQIRIDVGAAAPLEILEPRVTIATSEEQLIIATANVRTAEDTLRQLLNLDPAEWDRPIIPTDPVEYEPVTINVDDSVGRAMTLRPELRQDVLTTDTRRVQYLYSRNQTLPQVDFDLRYGLAGLAGNAEEIDPATGQGTGRLQRIPYGRGLRQIFEGDFPSWTIGFNVGVPITNIGARAESKRAELDYRQSQLQQVETRQTIAIDVRSAARDVDTAARSIVATRAARDAAERNVEAERRRYENGMTTNFQVLTIQQRLSDARIRELNALVGYNRAVAIYHRAVGDVLDVHGITVNSPELPEEPRIFSTLDKKYNWLHYGSRVKLEEEQK
ncbi:MAG TPA: TolC family protein [Thermoanaerobaculia bacterium]|jgi:HAE1 family hydrophobic/amphiphilic exporter-1|nr:TolC family protein [Thermoanaerobaculia bacterium]